MSVTRAAPMQAETVVCPQCGHENSSAAEFCTSCHAILIHRCPKCWHEQRQGGVCEKCGTNFALYLELDLERSLTEQNRVDWDKFLSRADAFAQILLLPFTSIGGILRLLISRLVSLRLSDR
ncbi:MAG TPA: zinc ribbon domain-containing protein [Candidatus Polarisedimenticolia bacterium]|nr:zinc ribbon domain-containing protein [Candidatus Polarisedimenticolia bacterium]